MQKHEYLTWIEISAANLRYNLNQFKKILPRHFKLMGVIKSNAYGHGMVQVARAIESRVDYFVVSCIEEALELRQAGVKKPILSLGNIDEQLIGRAARQNIELSVGNQNLLNKILRQNRKVNVHIKIDTGMTRYGFNIDDAAQVVKKAQASKQINLKGIMSHFAVADENLAYTRKQWHKFKNLSINLPYLHIANSAGALIKCVPGNAARIGISLYGLWPSEWSKKYAYRHHRNFNLKPVLTWKTRITQIKKVKSKVAVSYGCTYTTKRESVLAVLPIGYWDGFDRGLSNNGEVLIKGQRCKVVGRVCMNQTMIDISNVKNTRVNDPVVLIGHQNRNAITAEEIADKLRTINYEVVTRINPLIKRIVV